MKKEGRENVDDLKGTLFSVFGIGIFIFLLWFGIYGFYLHR